MSIFVLLVPPSYLYLKLSIPRLSTSFRTARFWYGVVGDAFKQRLRGFTETTTRIRVARYTSGKIKRYLSHRNVDCICQNIPPPTLLHPLAQSAEERLSAAAEDLSKMKIFAEEFVMNQSAEKESKGTPHANVFHSIRADEVIDLYDLQPLIPCLALTTFCVWQYQFLEKSLCLHFLTNAPAFHTLTTNFAVSGLIVLFIVFSLRYSSRDAARQTTDVRVSRRH